jgi:hypothetical protein
VTAGDIFAVLRQVVAEGERSPKGDTYKVDDLVWWVNAMGQKTPAVVAHVWVDCLDITVKGRAGTYIVTADELTPRTDDCPEGTEK